MHATGDCLWIQLKLPPFFRPNEYDLCCVRSAFVRMQHQKEPNVTEGTIESNLINSITFWRKYTHKELFCPFLAKPLYFYYPQNNKFDKIMYALQSRSKCSCNIIYREVSRLSLPIFVTPGKKKILITKWPPVYQTKKY